MLLLQPFTIGRLFIHASGKLAFFMPEKGWKEAIHG